MFIIIKSALYPYSHMFTFEVNLFMEPINTSMYLSFKTFSSSMPKVVLFCLCLSITFLDA